MSATLNNMHHLQRFLAAQLYTSTFRPVREPFHTHTHTYIYICIYIYMSTYICIQVSLKERVKIDNDIYTVDKTDIRGQEGPLLTLEKTIGFEVSSNYLSLSLSSN